MSRALQISQVTLKEEIAELIPLFRAQLEEHDLHVDEDGICKVCMKMIEEPKYGIILKATLGGAVVGVAFAATHLSVEYGGTIGWLEELYVSSAARGNGIGGALLNSLAVHARTLGWKGIQLEVVKGHERVISLYERYEFFPLDRTVFCRKSL